MEQGIQMVVFDWAGTTVDYGSNAPTEVFDQIFKAEGIHFLRNEIHGPMGMEKKDHIRALLSLKTGSEEWGKNHGRCWTEEDVERLYEKFEETLFQVVAAYSAPIPGVVETVKKLRQQGIKIGSTTGYHSQMMKQVLPKAEQEGYVADCVITPDITGMGRPAPFMLFECMKRLQVYPATRVVKVGDTVVDILEGKNAGAWSIGILTGSNLLGLTKEEYDSMDEEELKRRKKKAQELYIKAGADMVIDSILELPAAVETLNNRLV